MDVSGFSGIGSLRIVGGRNSVEGGNPWQEQEFSQSAFQMKRLSSWDHVYRKRMGKDIGSLALLLCAASGCGSTALLVEQSKMDTANYPLPYPANADCHWLIKAPVNTIMKLQFLDFEVEQSKECMYDSVSFFNDQNQQELIADCGVMPIEPQWKNKHIVGGEEAVPHSWPWQATLMYQGTPYCAGAVIHPSCIVAAASCFNMQVASPCLSITKKSIMDPTASGMFCGRMLSMVNSEDVNAIIQAQKHMLDRFEKTNEMLLNFNGLSNVRLQQMNDRFQHHTRTLLEMKKDLDSIFRRIRTLKGKISKQYPDAFNNVHESPILEDDDDDFDPIPPSTATTTATSEQSTESCDTSPDILSLSMSRCSEDFSQELPETPTSNGQRKPYDEDEEHDPEKE
ncbi:UNVERIFIED_CONTAM: hypothetical protein FKN15_019614 [Acipenser sinensis]